MVRFVSNLKSEIPEFSEFYSIIFKIIVRDQLKESNKQYEKSENDLKALQSVGQIVGEVLKQLTEDNCKKID